METKIETKTLFFAMNNFFFIEKNDEKLRMH